MIGWNLQIFYIVSLFLLIHSSWLFFCGSIHRLLVSALVQSSFVLLMKEMWFDSFSTWISSWILLEDIFVAILLIFVMSVICNLCVCGEFWCLRVSLHPSLPSFPVTCQLYAEDQTMDRLMEITEQMSHLDDDCQVWEEASSRLVSNYIWQFVFQK